MRRWSIEVSSRPAITGQELAGAVPLAGPVLEARRGVDTLEVVGQGQRRLKPGTRAICETGFCYPSGSRAIFPWIACFYWSR